MWHTKWWDVRWMPVLTSTDLMKPEKCRAQEFFVLMAVRIFFLVHLINAIILVLK